MNKLLIGTLIVFATFLAIASCDEAYFGFKTHANEHEFEESKSQKDYNPRYSFHLDPENISFFQMAIEVCDASLQYTEDHLDEACGAFLPGCVYCPWSSKLTREIKL
ncbi:hypothetical protein CYY_010438 [Polysphondylium violaceum]|uniref:BP74 N-terminal domain-containing protein n=1 Tax=Polysphondylium violaceum TaxID=133409 RepID=A0A8J4UZS1_9MYCE|nr:hypothetical protein CYY_010438 [Polysphondylium violaceum]